MARTNNPGRQPPAIWVHEATLEQLDPPGALPRDPLRALQITVEWETVNGEIGETIIGAPRAMVLGIIQTLIANLPTGDYVEGSE